MNKTARKYKLISAVFCIIAIGFFLLHHFEVIPTLKRYLTTVYVIYFVGLAMLFNSKSLRENSKKTSANICRVLSVLLIIIALGAIIYGCIENRISLWW